jgi:hypothetical protein
MKNELILSGILIIMLLSVSCVNQPPPVGNTASIESVTLAIALTDDMTSVVGSAKATVSASDMVEIESALVISGNMITGSISNIPVGKDRMFTILVYDKDTVLCYSGSADADIIAGAIAKVQLTLKKSPARQL